MIMDALEKVDRLRERANVSYEEAKEALEQAGGDLLDAMVILERAGRTGTPQQESYSTSYEEQKNYIRVSEKVEEQKKSAPSIGSTIGKAVRLIIRFVTHTSFQVSRREQLIFAMPSWVFALILLITWKVLIPVMIVALLFGIRYSFEGDGENTETANEYLSKAGSFADGLQSELRGRKDENGSGEGGGERG